MSPPASLELRRSLGAWLLSHVPTPDEIAAAPGECRLLLRAMADTSPEAQTALAELVFERLL